MRKNKMKTCALGLGLASIVAATASADITGAYVVEYSVTAADFGGAEVTVNIQDLYLASDDGADVALNVFNLNLVSEAQIDYFQSFTSTGWIAQNAGGPFDAPALRLADSFVTMGGFAQDALLPEQAPGAGSGSGLDPNFGGNSASYPGDLAGWYNGSPPNLNGQVGAVAQPGGGFGIGVLIGRFAYDGEFSLEGTTLEVTWNQGLGTPGDQQEFTVTPAPGALALLGLAGLSGRRRRG
jgi:MYXO-CTERM domain-containing protein